MSIVYLSAAQMTKTNGTRWSAWWARLEFV